MREVNQDLDDLENLAIFKREQKKVEENRNYFDMMQRATRDKL